MYYQHTLFLSRCNCFSPVEVTIDVDNAVSIEVASDKVVLSTKVVLIDVVVSSVVSTDVVVINAVESPRRKFSIGFIKQN